jgi:hypothetical protein
VLWIRIRIILVTAPHQGNRFGIRIRVISRFGIRVKVMRIHIIALGRSSGVTKFAAFVNIAICAEICMGDGLINWNVLDLRFEIWIWFGCGFSFQDKITI